MYYYTSQRKKVKGKIVLIIVARRDVLYMLTGKSKNFYFFDITACNYSEIWYNDLMELYK